MGTQYFTLPTSVADSLRCTVCQKYLSCGPIMRQKDEQKICGRCPSPIDGISELLYEQAMAKFVFPCSYEDKGCVEQLLFNNVNEHEFNCKYRTIRCPIANCMQSSSQQLIKQHFDEQHTDLIIKNGTKLELHKENLVSYVMIIENSVIAIFGYSYDWNKKLLNVKAGYVSKHDDQIVKYKVQLVKPDRLSSDLFYDRCNVYPIEETVISLESYSFDCTDGYNICIKLKIKTDQTSKSALAVLPVPKFMNDDDEIEAKAIYLMSKLDDLICRKCKIIIVPPIFKSKNSYDDKLYCKKCVRNGVSSYDESEMKIKCYPCKWKGCSVTCTDETIKVHIDACKFRKHVCLFCKPNTDFLISNDNMFSHLQGHAVYCSNPHNVRIDLYDLSNQTEINRYFTVLDNNIVYFTCKLFGENKWSFDCQFEDGIEIYVSFEHDHCRQREKDEEPYVERFSILPEEFKFPECFYLYRLLRIILRVETCTE